MPSSHPREWFAGPASPAEVVQRRAHRVADAERRSALIHWHRWSEPCNGRDHEQVLAVEQLTLPPVASSAAGDA